MTNDKASDTAIPDNKGTMPSEPVWVFECNTAGDLAGHVAHVAERIHGAKPGAPGKLVGNSYALPTRDEHGGFLPIDEVAANVRAFREQAETQHDRQFRVLPGTWPKSEDEQARYAEMFLNVPNNVLLPGRMLELQEKLGAVRLVILDINDRGVDPVRRGKALDEFFACNAGLWGTNDIEIVSYGLPQILVMNDKYARAKGYRYRILSIDAACYGQSASQAREILSIAHATKLVCVGDPMGTSTGRHIRALQFAASGGLEIAEVLVDEAAAA